MKLRSQNKIAPVSTAGHSMIRRSQVAPISNIIDFNEASIAWRKNKRSVGNGSFEYIAASSRTNNSSPMRTRSYYRTTN